MNDSKNDLAWQLLFKKYKIVENIHDKGLHEIRSSAINKYREARLMTKFDYKSQLPKIFVENNLSILPVSRGSYIISNFETFKDFSDDPVEVQKIDFPSYIESIDYNNITSEATALNCAYVSGIIQDFTKDEELKPTVSGRMGSSNFKFNIDSKNGLLNISVRNSQIEIDGGYEGVSSLNLIEAKNSISKDFLIRQVFYPYKLWQNKVDKKVRSMFLTYTNGVFHFREYDFEDPDHYNSLFLIREKKYILRDGAINLELVQGILNTITIIDEPMLPFPQADSFERVINLCELLNINSSLTREEVTIKYDFDVRQTNYYSDAGRYLGLIEKGIKDRQVIYFLTDLGRMIFQMTIIERQKKFMELILSHIVFNQALKLYFDKSEAPNRKEIVEIMRDARLHKIHSETTFKRRSSTILSWINWVLSQIEE